jgi:type I restriction enzyme M protein
MPPNDSRNALTVGQFYLEHLQSFARPLQAERISQVILPLTVLRRFDCLLAPTKAAVLEEYPTIKNKPETVLRSLLQKVTKRPFYNLSKLDFKKLLDDPNQLAPNLNSYINKFSPNVRAIMERFGFDEQIARMAEKNLLYEVIKAFAKIDLSSTHIDNVQMGYVFEELIRIGAEQANEEAGEHFTPREVIKLMVNLLLSPEKDLTHSHVVKTIYDPACGTGGMLSVSEKYIREPAVREVSARNSKTHRRDDDSAHGRERQDRDTLYGRRGVSELGVSNTCQGNSEFD